MTTKMRIKLTNDQGQSVMWRVWREARVFNVGGRLERPYTGPMWMVERHDGTCNGLEVNWINSVARIRHSAECYGFTAAIS